MNIAQGLNLISYGTEDDLYVNGQITDNSPYLAFEWKAGKDGEAPSGSHTVDRRI